MTNYKGRLRHVATRESVLQHFAVPIQLASGEWSQDFIDGKHAVADPKDLALAGEAMLAAARDAGVGFDAVGGLVLGAVPFTFAVSQAAGCPWFLIRKEPKGRGTNLWVEGARLDPGMTVMLVDDVVTTGGSIRKAYDKVRELGAHVSFATTLVDRGLDATEFFQKHGVHYKAMLTYQDLGIQPIGREHRAPTSAR